MTDMPFATPSHSPPMRYLLDANRWLVRQPLALATAILVGICVAGAAVLLVISSKLFDQELTPKIFMIAALITVLMATPVIMHAQTLLRRQRAARHRLKMMTRELAIALHNAQDVNQTRTKQLANMSHELRTPMNAIVGFSDILRYERFGPMENKRYLEFAADINDSAQHLLELINTLLDLAKVEAGGYDPADAEPVELADAVNMAVRLLRPLADQQGVHVSVEIADSELQILAIERMLRQVLINLLSNAIKFTPPNGNVLIQASRNQAGRAEIRVRDTGIGMSAADIRTAFVPFGQVDSMISRKHTGTGLGLPLAKAMVELNDGSLDLHSAEGEGTEVTLTFPVVEGDQRVALMSQAQIRTMTAKAAGR